MRLHLPLLFSSIQRHPPLVMSSLLMITISLFIIMTANINVFSITIANAALTASDEATAANATATPTATATTTESKSYSHHIRSPVMERTSPCSGKPSCHCHKCHPLPLVYESQTKRAVEKARANANSVYGKRDHSNREMEIMDGLLHQMKASIGKKQMQTAFANGVFADGMMTILNDIGSQKIADHLSAQYGDMNVRILLFWARIYALSGKQFVKIQKELMDIKDIEQCVQRAIEERDNANKAKLLGLFDYIITAGDTDLQMTRLMDEAMGVIVKHGVHCEDDEDDEDDDYDDEYDDRFGEEDNTKYLCDEWNRDPLANATAAGDCLLISSTNNANNSSTNSIGGDHPFFISHALNAGDCWATGNLHPLFYLFDTRLQWDFQLLNPPHPTVPPPCELQLLFINTDETDNHGHFLSASATIHLTDTIRDTHSNWPGVSFASEPIAADLQTEIVDALSNGMYRGLVVDGITGTVQLAYEDVHTHQLEYATYFTFSISNQISDCPADVAVQFVMNVRMSCPLDTGVVLFTHCPPRPPTPHPTNYPTEQPTENPTQNPTANPTAPPTVNPTSYPTQNPTAQPTGSPSVSPTQNPTGSPTTSPTANPTTQQTTLIPPYWAYWFQNITAYEAIEAQALVTGGTPYAFFQSVAEANAMQRSSNSTIEFQIYMSSITAWQQGRQQGGVAVAVSLPPTIKSGSELLFVAGSFLFKDIFFFF